MPKQREKLHELAMRRGEKGVSSIIEEALEDYLRAGEVRERLRCRALRLRGALSAAEAAALRRECRASRVHWR